ncbi:MAG: acyl-CoA synthetase [Aeromicrobium sp.]|nr:acyl-CoA synthetase [Aeromicrobium sp.]
MTTGNEFNIGLAHELLGTAMTDREVLVWRDRRLTYGQLADRSRRLATYLHRAGLGAHRERSELANHESGQDHIALYLHNGTEYVEGMLGAFKSRCVSINVNYRYVDEELRYLFGNANAKAVIYHATFAPRLAAIRDALPNLTVLLQVDDGSGEPLLPGAVDYEEALASVPADLPDVGHSPDDLYVLYTGGTTGMPKGVLWRQHDIFMSAMGGQVPGVWDAISSYDEFVERAVAGAEGGGSMVMVPPFMHGAAQWSSFIMMAGGTKIVIPDENTHMDAADILRTIEREGAATITVVGDAVVRPLLDEIKTGRYDLSSLVVVGNGSAALSPELKEQLLEELPNIFINDSMGASETGAQASHLSAKGNVSTGRFSTGPGAVVVSDDMTALLKPGHDGIGWLGQSGWVPLGYLGDAEKTAKTFPTISGTRYAVPGDRARLLANGEVEVLGRESATINTGGEKVFAEEVEAAITSHPAVRDVLVVGRPHERWGNEVVAVIQLEEGAEVSDADLAAHAGERIARYKIPKGWVFVSQIQRSPSGKADYRWAHAIAMGE